MRVPRPDGQQRADLRRRVFDESLLREFGWTRGTLKFRDLLTYGLSGVLAPFAGALADRFGVKWLMVFGAAVLAAAFLAYGHIASAGHMYAIHVAFAVTLSTAGMVMAVILISRWFVRKRGTATGIALVGASVGGALFPVAAAWLIQPFGWRASFTILAACPAALVLVVLLFVRDRPADIGLEPLGAQAAGSGQPGAAAGGVEYRDALRTPAFWLIAAAGMLILYAILGTAGHVFLHLRGQGVPVQEAAEGSCGSPRWGCSGRCSSASWRTGSTTSGCCSWTSA